MVAGRRLAVLANRVAVAPSSHEREKRKREERRKKWLRGSFND
jgi:hypothetical protein